MIEIIDISVKDYASPQHKLVPDELQNCHSHYRWDREMWTLSYHHGYREPRFPVPAIPLQMVWPPMGYDNMIYIDSLQYGEDDPVMRCCWDFYDKNDPHYGQYQPTYTDAEVDAGWGEGNILIPSPHNTYTVPTYDGDYVDEIKYPR